jgi:hypothetical protein
MNVVKIIVILGLAVMSVYQFSIGNKPACAGFMTSFIANWMLYLEEKLTTRLSESLKTLQAEIKQLIK